MRSKNRRRRGDSVMDRLVHDLNDALAPVRNVLQLLERDDADLKTMAFAREVIARRAAAQKQRSVLIIDDNRNWVDSLAAVLVAEGYKIDAAYGGQEGVEAAVAVSVWGEESARIAGRQAGFNHHLTKPLAFSELQKILA